VNNNYCNILFGVALINNEKKPTYKWIFQNVVEINGTEPLMIIISDSDLATNSAIEEEFPNAQKRLCSWHVMRNLKFHFR